MIEVTTNTSIGQWAGRPRHGCGAASPMRRTFPWCGHCTAPSGQELRRLLLLHQRAAHATQPEGRTTRSARPRAVEHELTSRGHRCTPQVDTQVRERDAPKARDDVWGLRSALRFVVRRALRSRKTGCLPPGGAEEAPQFLPKMEPVQCPHHGNVPPAWGSRTASVPPACRPIAR